MSGTQSLQLVRDRGLTSQPMSRLTRRLVIRGVNGCSGPPSALLPSAWPSWRSRWRSLLLRLADGDEVLLWWGLDDLHLRHCAASGGLGNGPSGLNVRAALQI